MATVEDEGWFEDRKGLVDFIEKRPSIDERIQKMSDHQMEEAFKGKCKCFQIEEGKGVHPDNLMCNVSGLQGYLSNELEKNFCFQKSDEEVEEKWEEIEEELRDIDLEDFNEALKEDKPENAVENEELEEAFSKFTIEHEVETPPSGYEDHMKRMKNDVSLLWNRCMEDNTEKNLWVCVDDLSDEVIELYDLDTEELVEKGEEIGLALDEEKMTDQEMVRKLSLVEEYDGRRRYHEGDVVSYEGDTYVATGITTKDPDEGDKWATYT